ncbi:hypothetical protein L484_017519 [Morus notabilis]|uniref:CRAL-TRIO domain-containing protein n=1 Tax=Morus notabilis TaxID=981085 RepID=W9QTM0_9ROSA|nr:hypothetical protein L484_017519 [Morus notabilis]
MNLANPSNHRSSKKPQPNIRDLQFAKPSRYPLQLATQISYANHQTKISPSHSTPKSCRCAPLPNLTAQISLPPLIMVVLKYEKAFLRKAHSLNLSESRFARRGSGKAFPFSHINFFSKISPIERDEALAPVTCSTKQHRAPQAATLLLATFFFLPPNLCVSFSFESPPRIQISDRDEDFSDLELLQFFRLQGFNKSSNRIIRIEDLPLISRTGFKLHTSSTQGSARGLYLPLSILLKWRIKYVSRLQYLWDDIKKDDIEIPDFVKSHDGILEHRPLTDYGIEPDSFHLFDAPSTAYSFGTDGASREDISHC